MIELNQLSEEAYDTAVLRDQKPKATLKHCAGEVIEAAQAEEIYRTRGLYDPDYLEQAKKELSLELADIVICCMTCSFEYGIDLEKAIRTKMQANRYRIKK